MPPTEIVLGVVSDTHMPRFGRALPAALVRGLQRARVALILHLGDFTAPHVVEWFEAIAPVEAVAGNNDGTELHTRFGRRRIVNLGGLRIGMIHGDGTRGTTPQRALAAFDALDVDAICFGHSHQPLCERRGHLLLFNPGSPSDKRRAPRYSFGLLRIGGGRIVPRLAFFDDKSP